MKFLIFTLLLASSVSFAQTLDRQVIGSTGSYANGGTFSVSMTVGEPVVATAITGTIILTQGFQQPDDILIGVHQPQISMTYSVFPNPAVDNITVQLTTETLVTLSLTLYDAAGKLVKVLNNRLLINGSNTSSYSLAGLASGNYFLYFLDLDGKKIETISVQKH